MTNIEDYLLQRKEKEHLFIETLKIKKEIYDKYPVGGALHIVLDDGNLRNCYIECCLEDINKLKYDKELFLKCANNILKMSMRQRIKLYKAR